MDYKKYTNQISRVNIEETLNEEGQFDNSESTSSASQQNCQEKLCQSIDELCQIFEKK